MNFIPSLSVLDFTALLYPVHHRPAWGAKAPSSKKLVGLQSSDWDLFDLPMSRGEVFWARPQGISARPSVARCEAHSDPLVLSCTIVWLQIVN